TPPPPHTLTATPPRSGPESSPPAHDGAAERRAPHPRSARAPLIAATAAALAVAAAVVAYAATRPSHTVHGSPVAIGTTAPISATSAKGPDSVTDLCSLFSAAEATAAVGVPMHNKPEGNGRFHKICFYVSSQGAVGPVVEIHLLTSSAAPRAVAAAGKQPGANAVPGLGKAAFAGQVGIDVLLDDLHYLTVSTGLATNDVQKDIAIAKVLVHRLGY
ncbi:MAG: hypothetical protein ABR604_08115, partial [Jatrophihabitantaceae bacterium]